MIEGKEIKSFKEKEIIIIRIKDKEDHQDSMRNEDQDKMVMRLNLIISMRISLGIIKGMMEISRDIIKEIMKANPDITNEIMKTGQDITKGTMKINQDTTNDKIKTKTLVSTV